MKIKFKAWDSINKKILSWDYIKENNLFHIINDDDYVPFIISSYYNKSVCAGDIIKFGFVSNNCNHNFKYGIIFYNNVGEISIKSIDFYYNTFYTQSLANKNFDILGNIFEHPYLLQQLNEHPDNNRYNPHVFYHNLGLSKDDVNLLIEKSKHFPRALLIEKIKNKNNKIKENIKEEIDIIRKQRRIRMEKYQLKNKRYYKIYLHVKNNIEEYEKKCLNLF